MLCLRVMVASIVLFDHLDENGAFMKDSQINIKNAVKVIEASGGDHKTNLLNALRYNSKHFNDESTPRSVKNILSST